MHAGQSFAGDAASSAADTSRPSATLPKKRNRSCPATCSNTWVTDLSFGWSGATPKRTSP